MKKILSIAIVGLSLYGFVGCDDMNTIHEDYLNEGADVYIGAPQEVIARSGYERVELSWMQNSDPKIKETVIYWNSKRDSVVVPSDLTAEIMTKSIAVPQGAYIFELMNRSEAGDMSLVQLVSTESFGETYKSGLKNRPVLSQVVFGNGVKLVLGPLAGCVGVDYSYENNLGEMSTGRVAIDQNEIKLADYMPGGDISLTSLYRPTEDAVDEVSVTESITVTFSSDFSDLTYAIISEPNWVDATQVKLDRSEWVATASSEATADGMTPSKILDGDYGSMWHSDYATPAQIPHWIEVDMLSEQMVSSMEIARRTSLADKGHTKTVNFSKSDDGMTWTHVGSFAFTLSSNDYLVIHFKEMFSARYLRLDLPDSNETPYATMTEFVVNTNAPAE